MTHRAKRLAEHSQQEIASAFTDALCDLTGQIYSVEIVSIQHHPDEQADNRLWARRMDDSEIPETE